jgi:large subunit ribosomal protein L35
MPKQKTNKSVRKRIRVTGTGKLKRNKANKRHLLSGRTSKRKRQLRKGVILPNSITAKYLRALGQGGN